MEQATLTRYYEDFKAVGQRSLERYYDDFPLRPAARRRLNIDFAAYYADASEPITETLAQERANPPHLNLWEGIGLERSELKHCAFVAWLLNPFASHNQGARFLRHLVKAAAMDELTAFIGDHDFKVIAEDAYSEGRVDIVVKSRHFLLMIEAKIDAGEQKAQIKRYRQVLAHEARVHHVPKARQKLIFLTLDGKKPLTGEVDAMLSWHQVAQAARAFAAECVSPFLREAVFQYSDFIEMNLY